MRTRVVAEIRAAQLIVAAGLAALVTGVQLVSLLIVAAIGPSASPPWLTTPWFVATALVAGGAVLASGGTMRPSVARSSLRTRRPSTWAAVIAAGGLFWLLAVWAVPATSAFHRPVLLLTPVSQVALIGLWRWWSRPGPGTVRGLAPRTWPNLLIIGFLALSAATVLLRLHDVYPFSRYPMFAAARVDPYTLERVTFIAIDADGGERRLRAPASRHVLLDLVDAGDERTLEGMAARLADRHQAPLVVVILEVVAVAEHPAPPGFDVRERREVLVVER